MVKGLFGDEFIMASTSDIYGGQQVNISMSPMYAPALRWLVTFQKEYEAEKQLRESNTAVKNAWEQYQVIKTLAIKETEK
jgi:hypothetical protein